MSLRVVTNQTSLGQNPYILTAFSVALHGRLGSEPRLVSRIRSGVRVSSSLRKPAEFCSTPQKSGYDEGVLSEGDLTSYQYFVASLF